MNGEKRTDLVVRGRWLRIMLLIMALLWVMTESNAVAAGDGTFYFRVGAGIAVSGNTGFSDVACDAESGVALFGCAGGNDDRPIGAYGDFGNSGVLDLGVGYRWNTWFRMELTLTERSGFRFDGRSNFSQLDPSIEQHVEGDARSFSALLSGVIRPLTLLGRERLRFDPFVAGGVGLSRNRIDAMVYTFPSTQTITPVGRQTAFAWSIGGGFRYRLKENVELEIRHRYTDLGSVNTDTGIMIIRSRSTGDVINDAITINGTTAGLTVRETILSMIWTF